MKKIIELWGIFILLSVCLLIALFQEPQEEQIDWEPLIVETTPIEPDAVTLLENEVRETRNWDENTTDTTIQLSYEDAQLLMKIASAEAGSQGVRGMKLVMCVVLNRINDENYPNTVWEVFTQKGQFSTYSNGSWKNVEISPESHEALAELEKNQNLDTTIFAFETLSNGDTLTRWFDTSYVYLNHKFYTKKEN